MRTNTEDLRLLVSFEEDTGLSVGEKHLRAIATVVRIEDGKVRNIGSEMWRNPAAWAHDFAVTAAASTGLGSGYYAYTAEYRNVYCVELERAELMAKTLRKVKRGLERLEQTQAAPLSFGQYLARVASIVGVSTFGWVSEQGRGWSWDECEFHWTDAAGIDYHLTRKLRDVFPLEGVAA